MKIIKNKVTVKVTITSQIQFCFCDVIVTKKAVSTLIDCNMSLTLKNKQYAAATTLPQLIPIALQFHSSNSGFVRSLFALCSLLLRFKSEETAPILDLNSGIRNSKSFVVF